jgi:hypothetical protein
MRKLNRGVRAWVVLLDFIALLTHKKSSGFQFRIVMRNSVCYVLPYDKPIGSERLCIRF